MVRWEPGAAERLHTAALELFAEHGFAAVTVPQITAKAGLTTRTFFRHFADKREILFAGDEGIPATMTAIFAEADPDLAPMEVCLRALRETVAPLFSGQRDYLRRRRDIIRTDEGLQERELHKSAVLVDAGAAGFRERGLDPATARIVARVSILVFDEAVTQWLDHDGPDDLADVVTAVAAEVGAAAAPLLDG